MGDAQEATIIADGAGVATSTDAPMDTSISSENIEVEGVVGSETTVGDTGTNSQENHIETNVQYVVAADFTASAEVIGICDEFQHVEVSGGNFVKGVKWCV